MQMYIFLFIFCIFAAYLFYHTLNYLKMVLKHYNKIEIFTEVEIQVTKWSGIDIFFIRDKSRLRFIELNPEEGAEVLQIKKEIQDFTFDYISRNNGFVNFELFRDLVSNFHGEISIRLQEEKSQDNSKSFIERAKERAKNIESQKTASIFVNLKPTKPKLDITQTLNEIEDLADADAGSGSEYNILCKRLENIKSRVLSFKSRPTIITQSATACKVRYKTIHADIAQLPIKVTVDFLKKIPSAQLLRIKKTLEILELSEKNRIDMPDQTRNSILQEIKENGNGEKLLLFICQQTEYALNTVSQYLNDKTLSNEKVESAIFEFAKKNIK